MDIRYSDGNRAETAIREILAVADDRRSTDTLGVERYRSWAIHYHLSPERANLLRPFDFTGLDVLELGAGMGGVSRYLGETARSLHAVEGTRSRFDALRLRLRDLGNWTGDVGNFAHLTLEPRFDCACLIGVLEYSELYIPAAPGCSPFEQCLAHAARALREDGVVLIAIENRLGLKYWSGSAEDHSNRLYDGICGYPSTPCPRTFSLRELRGMLARQGFAAVEEFFPFPDYKLPRAVLSRSIIDDFAQAAVSLATAPSYELFAPTRVRQFPEWLAVESLASAGLLSEMANSFLLVASRREDSPTLHRVLRRTRQMGEVAWHYAWNRAHPTETTFTRQGNRLAVHKALLRDATPRFDDTRLAVQWRHLGTHDLLEGIPLRLLAMRHAYFDETESLQALLCDYLAWALHQWRLDEALCGLALDATIANAVQAAPFAVFDLEWELDGPLRKSWFVLRNVLSLCPLREMMPPGPPFRSLAELYRTLCLRLAIAPDLARDIDDEACFRSLVTNLSSTSAHRRGLRRVMTRPVAASVHPRMPTEAERDFLAGVPRPRRLLRQAQ